jgi:hypothetical protein
MLGIPGQLEQYWEDDTMRTYLNFEKTHIEALLRLLAEVEKGRYLNPPEQYVQMILQEALDNIDKGM